MPPSESLRGRGTARFSPPAPESVGPAVEILVVDDGPTDGTAEPSSRHRRNRTAVASGPGRRPPVAVLFLLKYPSPCRDFSFPPSPPPVPEILGCIGKSMFRPRQW